MGNWIDDYSESPVYVMSLWITGLCYNYDIRLIIVHFATKPFQKIDLAEWKEAYSMVDFSPSRSHFASA